MIWKTNIRAIYAIPWWNLNEHYPNTCKYFIFKEIIASSIRRKRCFIVALCSVYLTHFGRNGYDPICTGESNFVQAVIEASKIHIWAWSDKRKAKLKATIFLVHRCIYQLFLGKGRTIVVCGRLYAKTTNYEKGHVVYCIFVNQVSIFIYIWDSTQTEKKSY